MSKFENCTQDRAWHGHSCFQCFPFGFDVTPYLCTFYTHGQFLIYISFGTVYSHIIGLWNNQGQAEESMKRTSVSDAVNDLCRRSYSGAELSGWALSRCSTWSISRDKRWQNTGRLKDKTRRDQFIAHCINNAL